MKKTFLLLTAAVLLTTIGSGINANATNNNTSQQILVAGEVPRSVLAVYSQQIEDIMNANFPDNRGWEDSEVTWTRDRNVWTATGKIRRVDGGGGPYIMLHAARFTSNGTSIELDYSVIIPV